MTTKAERSTLIAVLYDTKTGYLLGKRGKWMTCAEFAKDPPQRQEELLAEDGSHRVDDSDPSIIVKCIDGIKHYCVGSTCSPVPPGDVSC